MSNHRGSRSRQLAQNGGQRRPNRHAVTVGVLNRRLWTRLPIIIGALVLVTSGIAMGASGVGGGRHGAASLTNRDSVYSGASISGTVKDANGQPITTDDVCVQAFQPTSNDGWTYSFSAVTNSSGQYTISGLQSGSYKVAFADCNQVYAYSSQYASSTRNDVPQYYSGTTEWSSASLVVLSAGGAKTGIDAQLAAATSIAGHVYTSPDNSTPKQSECMSAQQASTGGTPSWVTGPLSYYYEYYNTYSGNSASDGSYHLQHLKPSAEYVVEFYDCGYPKTYLTQFDGAVATPQSATVLTPTLGSPTTGIDAHLAVGGKIAGSVTDSHGNPITTSDICVYATRLYGVGGADEHPYDDYSSATTDATGSYVIGGLSAGSYDVHFEDCNYYNSVRNDVAQYYNGKSSYSEATPVEVTLGAQHAGIGAALAPGTSISGHVYGSLDTTKPLQQICVYAYAASETSQFPQQISYGYSGPDGSYTVKHLPPGSGDKLFFVDCGGHGYTAQYYNDVSTLAAASVLTPTLTEPITGIDAHLANSAPETEITGGPANNAATNATTASFSFTSTIAGATFECQLDSGGFSACTSPFATGTLTSGQHTFTVRGKANGITDPNPATVTWTVAPSSPTSTSQGSVPPGGTVSSDPGVSASASDPVVAAATLPSAGTVTMTKEPASTPSENGYTVFGQQLDIAATQPGGTTPLVGTPANPIALTFEIDGSAIPAGTEPSTITVLRNGVAAANCTGGAGTAEPDPCVESRTPIAGGGVKLTVLTTHCSLWNFAKTPTTSPPPGGGGSGGGSTNSNGSGGGTGTGGSTGGPLGGTAASATATIGHVKVSGPAASVPVRCAGASGATCKLSLSLSIMETVKGGKVIAVSAAKKKTMVLATASVTIAAGQTKTIVIALNAIGKHLLSTRHSLKVKLAITQAGVAKASVVSGQTITFKATQKHKG